MFRRGPDNVRRIPRGVKLNARSIALLTSSNGPSRAEHARKPPVTDGNSRSLCRILVEDLLVDVSPQDVQQLTRQRQPLMEIGRIRPTVTI